MDTKGIRKEVGKERKNNQPLTSMTQELQRISSCLDFSKGDSSLGSVSVSEICRSIYIFMMYYFLSQIVLLLTLTTKNETIALQCNWT